MPTKSADRRDGRRGGVNRARNAPSGTALHRLSAVLAGDVGSFASRFGNSWQAVALIAVPFTAAALAHTLAEAGPSNPALELTVETSTTVAALLAVGALADYVRRTRELRAMWLLIGTAILAIAEAISYSGPQMLGLGSVHSLAAGPTVATVFTAASFAAAAFTPKAQVLSRDRQWRWFAGGVAVGVVSVAELTSWASVEAVLPAQPGAQNITNAPFDLVLAVAAATVLLVLAAIRMLEEPDSKDPWVDRCFAATAILLSVGLVERLATLSPNPEVVSPGTLIPLMAFVLIVIGAARMTARHHREVSLSIAERERRRLARDLHDGLCQDLAFIASHGTRLVGEDGTEHPMATAARRALDASRGILADLSATGANDIAEALETVARELSRQFGVSVEVRAQAVKLTAEAREGLVRIAREAVVNAARHGQAEHVTIEAGRTGSAVVLRVTDDGVGIDPDSRDRDRFGMTSMRQRARELGGRLDAQALQDGGTRVEVVVW